MPSTRLTFDSRAAHREWLASQSALPRGFRAGTTRFEFVPFEVTKPATMTLALIALERPSTDFAAVFTRNAFPGAPVVVGRRRLQEEALGAILVNNKISNVCAPGGIEQAERLCRETAKLLDMPPRSVLPASTGVIGWRLPVDAMIAALPSLVAALSDRSLLPVAEGIMTTDLYPKVRCCDLADGTIVGVAKGAGMIEPNLATMLVYILTDVAVPRGLQREWLGPAVDRTFNRISIDSETSTSDSVVLLSSALRPLRDPGAFERALVQLCGDLAEDVVRNGEGVRHLLRVSVRGAPDEGVARAIGKAVVNAPLFKCAIAGNDPNVGRLVQAVGKHVGPRHPSLDLSRTCMRMGGITILENGEFYLDPAKEQELVGHLRGAELYASAPSPDGVFSPPIDYPAHERSVEVEIDLRLGDGDSTVLGADLTHEYVSENADYRS